MKQKKGKEKESNQYIVLIYTKYGYFEYKVQEMNSAIEHAQLIMERTVYRHLNERNELEFHKVIKTKVIGKGLQGKDPGKFKRT